MRWAWLEGRINRTDGHRENGRRARSYGAFEAIVKVRFYSQRDDEPFRTFEQKNNIICFLIFKRTFTVVLKIEKSQEKVWGNKAMIMDKGIIQVKDRGLD